MYCEVCGAKLKDGDNFCEVCGARVQPQQPKPVQQGWAQQPDGAKSVNSGNGQPKKKKPKQAAGKKQKKSNNEANQNKVNRRLLTFAITAGVIAVLAVTLFLVYFLSPARKVVTRLDEGEYQEAESIYQEKVADSEMQMVILKPLLSRYIQDLENAHKNDEITFDARVEKLSMIDALNVPGMENKITAQYSRMARETMSACLDETISSDTAAKQLDLLQSVCGEREEVLTEITTARKELSLPENELAGNTAGEDNPEEIYLTYVNEVLVPQYGMSDLSGQRGSMTTTTDSWLNPEGILSVYIGNVESDSVTNMLVFYLQEGGAETYQEGQIRYSLYASLYGIEEQEPVCLSNIPVKPYSGYTDEFGQVSFLSTEWSISNLHITAVNSNGKPCIVVESTSWARAFADGYSCDYWGLMADEDGNLYVPFSFTQTGGGSSDFEYTGYEITADGTVVRDELLVADAGGGTYSDFDTALTGFFADYGITAERSVADHSADSVSIIPDSAAVSRILDYGIVQTSSSSPYSFEVQAVDGTDIRGKLAEMFGEAEADSSAGESQLLPSDLPDSFCFSSGVGGWATVLSLNADGSFTGNYYDGDMGVTGDDYPNGTMYICDFSGRFTGITKINDYTYSMTLDYVETEKEPETEWIEEGLRYVASEPYGIEGGTEFLLYVPGAPISELPEGYLSWANLLWYGEDAPETMPSYGLYNVDMEEGFF